VFYLKKKVLIKFSQFLLIALIAIFAVSCANSITSPTGGPKDVTPPVVLETIPENGSSGFDKNKFSIRFNEFVSLKDIQTSALISPPMSEIPTFTIKGKSVVVKFNEDLKPNTTYSVFFGEAIVDITEKNPITNYTYIFSTGDYVDSLSLAGNVYNAFDLKPVDGTFVMLYKDNNDTIAFDSLPYFVPPYYLSKTDEKGRFQFEGLAEDKYLLFAVKDQNSNYFFDQPGEQIAFFDSLVQPIYFVKPVPDTIPADSNYSIEIKTDTIIAIADSLLPDSAFSVLDMGINMYMFLPIDTIQRLLKAEVFEKNAVRFAFSQPAENVDFSFVNYPLEDSLFVENFSISKDTIYWYLNNPPNDSLELLLTQHNDTLGTVYLKLDTEKKSPRLRGKDKKEKKETLSWKSNVKNNKLALNKHLEIYFSQPYIKYNNIDSLLLVVENDSIWNPEFEFTDSLYMNLRFDFDLKEGTKYKISFPDSSFTSWNNIHTKAIDINFNTLQLSDYGVFTFILFPEVKQNYILQLLSEDEIVIREVLFSSDTSIMFEYLKPTKYLSKIIFDTDNSGKWSGGNYGSKIMPEKVIYYPKEIKVRANWEIEEEWAF